MANKIDAIITNIPTPKAAIVGQSVPDSGSAGGVGAAVATEQTQFVLDVQEALRQKPV